MILIVGAGPVGLTAALELARRGIEARIIDQAENPSRLSKAVGVNARSLEILEPSGVSAALIEAGTKIRRANLHDRGRRRFTLDLARVPHRYNFMLALPQSHTEAILADGLQSRGLQVERGTALVRVELTGERARCWLKSRTGESQITTKMLIGADGAHSLVRRSASLSFLGKDYAHDWSLMDVRLDWDADEEEVNLFRSDQGLLFAITMGPGRYRLASDQPDPRALLPKEARVRSIFWRSSFRIAHRQTAAYRKGPVFLAGDAAHVHSPVSARGMNLGIEDAAVLASLIAHKDAVRYHELRHPVGRRTITLVDRQTHVLASRGLLARALLGHLAPVLMGFQSLHDAQCRHMLGLGQRTVEGL